MRPLDAILAQAAQQYEQAPALTVDRHMTSERQQAIAEFKRIMVWIAVTAVLMVAGALTYLYLSSSLDTNTVIATTLRVFFSVLLACGLFAAAFFSSKSGYDQSVTDVTKSERDRK